MDGEMEGWELEGLADWVQEAGWKTESGRVMKDMS